MPLGEADVYAAVSLLGQLSGSLWPAIGEVHKHDANPLFVQDRPWESPIDNGYPNVVPPADHGDAYQLWYGSCCCGGCHRQLLLYANSTDGLRWRKPELGLFNLDTAGIAELAGLGTANNILVEGGGIGVMRDAHDPDAARRFKAIGPGCWSSPTLARTGGFCGDIGMAPPGRTHEAMAVPEAPAVAAASPEVRRFVGQRAASADGLRWHDVVNVSWPPPQKWDTHTNAFYDETLRR